MHERVVPNKLGTRMRFKEKWTAQMRHKNKCYSTGSYEKNPIIDKLV